MAKVSKKGLHPADMHAGKMLRRLRICKGLSQNELGKMVGLTFQQIQKYERGENRMSVSRIHQLCQLFKVPPSEFFSEELEVKPQAGTNHDSLRLMRLFSQIHDQSKRAIIITVAEGLADTSMPTEEDAECQL